MSVSRCADKNAADIPVADPRGAWPSPPPRRHVGHAPVLALWFY